MLKVYKETEYKIYCTQSKDSTGDHSGNKKNKQERNVEE